MPGEPLKVLIKGPFSGYSGYGNDSFGLLRALHRWGCDVYPQPTWVDVPIPQDLLPLFGKTLRPPFDLLINHWAPAHLEISREARQMVRVAVGWTMWEFSPPFEGALKPCPSHRKKGLTLGVPDCPAGLTEKEILNTVRCSKPVNSGFTGFAGHGVNPNIQTMRKRLQWYDMVLGYDPVSVSAVLPYTRDKQYVGVLQGGFDSGDWKPVQRDWHTPKLGFFMHGQLGSRKCPWTTIEAFQKLKFEKPGPWPEGFDGAYLNLHTSAPGHLFPELNKPFESQRIRVYCEAWDRPTLQDFYAANHVGVFPSRGEGKNLPALECMTTGCTVAASDYGGHTQWLGGDWAYPLEGTLQPTFGDKPWAARDFKVTVDHLASTLWHIWTHRGEAEQKARQAQELIPKMCDWQVVTEALFRRIRDAVPSNNVGPQVYDKAMLCRIDDKQELIAAGPWS